MKLIKSGLRILFPCLLFLNIQSQAASLNINPVDFHLSQEKKIDTLTLTNQGDQPLTIHFQTQEWFQDKGQNTLQNTKDIMVLPNTCVIPPQSSQIMRIILKTTPHLYIEKAYRIRLVEGSATDAALKIQRGLGMKLEMSLPVFVDPLQDKGIKNPQMKISMQDNKLKFYNAGTKNLNLMKIRIPAVKKEHYSINKCILPNCYYIWSHSSISAMPKNVEVTAQINNEVHVINADFAP